MKIVILDGYTLNPGDLSWEGREENIVCRFELQPEKQMR